MVQIPVVWSHLMFCKVPHKQDISSSMIITRMSDHFPCIVNLKTPGESRKQYEFIYTRTICDSVMISFWEKLSRQSAQVPISIFLGKKRVKLIKYKRKLSPWITTGVIKSIKFCENLYNRLKTGAPDCPEHNQYNLKIYNGYLRQCIRAAKTILYLWVCKI